MVLVLSGQVFLQFIIDDYLKIEYIANQCTVDCAAVDEKPHPKQDVHCTQLV